MGRVTYEIFAAFWPTAPNDDGFADRMNDLPKYVVSKPWRTVLAEHDDHRGWPRRSGTELKQEPGGDIYLYGSADLLNSLTPHELIDEYRIMVFPVLLGSGKRVSTNRPTRPTWSSTRPGRSSPASPCSPIGRRIWGRRRVRGVVRLDG